MDFCTVFTSLCVRIRERVKGLLFKSRFIPCSVQKLAGPKPGPALYYWTVMEERKSAGSRAERDVDDSTVSQAFLSRLCQRPWNRLMDTACL